MAAPSALPGVAYALGSFGLWGLFPLYFKAVSAVPATEVLAHRVVWSVVFVGLLLLLVRQWGTVGAILADRERRTRLIADRKSVV